ncbi:MAG: hypothetical protein FWD44_08960 [Oscillospiraceae bacterium]|nr:hypothetical protein [Oscillospiraceae bacterium]
MKKRIIIMLFIVLSLCVLSACENNANTNNTLIKFGYSDLKLDFAWDIRWCHINFTITGDTTDVAGVFISGHKSSSGFSDAEILDMAQWVSFEHLELENGRYDGRADNGHISDGFEIDDIGHGKSGYILFFAIDINKEVIGYVIIPVTVPEAHG